MSDTPSVDEVNGFTDPELQDRVSHPSTDDVIAELRIVLNGHQEGDVAVNVIKLKRWLEALRVSGAGPDLTPWVQHPIECDSIALIWQQDSTGWRPRAVPSGRPCTCGLSSALRVVAVRTQEQEHTEETQTRGAGER
jgi:hypothetical protein